MVEHLYNAGTCTADGNYKSFLAKQIARKSLLGNELIRLAEIRLKDITLLRSVDQRTQIEGRPI